MSNRPILPVLVLAGLTLAAAGVSAHLSIVRTLPAGDASLSEPPDRVQMWFSEPPSPRVSRLEMTGPDGDVPLGELAVDREERSIAAAVGTTLGPGRYEVSWRTAGNDGHVMRGTFAFSVAPAE